MKISEFLDKGIKVITTQKSFGLQQALLRSFITAANLKNWAV